METIINAWLAIWLYVMMGIGIYLSWLVYKNRKTWDFINIICTLAIVVLVLHVIEEWVLPGGLHYSYNIDHNSTILSRYPMNRLTDMITNFGGVLLGCIVLKFWGFRKPAGIAVMLFSVFEVVIHIVIGIHSMHTFGAYGQNVLYSPGLITSLFGFLPICIALAVHLFKKANRPTRTQWIMAIVAMFGFCFLLINLPEMTLGDENSPYVFTDRGYYEQFAEEYEADNNLLY
ncbi:MAG: HXXEE domain-containing protein [Clostridia bacterium]|nr:HXXEE domain-containing protein [Clostridia bacterium]